MSDNWPPVPLDLPQALKAGEAEFGDGSELIIPLHAALSGRLLARLIFPSRPVQPAPAVAALFGYHPEPFGLAVNDDCALNSAGPHIGAVLNNIPGNGRDNLNKALSLLADIAEVPTTDLERLRVIARQHNPEVCDELVKAGASDWLMLVARDEDGELQLLPAETVGARWHAIAGGDIAKEVLTDYYALKRCREETSAIAGRLKDRANALLDDPAMLAKLDLYLLGEYTARRSVKQ